MAGHVLVLVLLCTSKIIKSNFPAINRNFHSRYIFALLHKVATNDGILSHWDNYLLYTKARQVILRDEKYRQSLNGSEVLPYRIEILNIVKKPARN